MIYTTLAPFYDLLVKDEEATQMWVDFTKQHSKLGHVLELACGSGEITIALAQEGVSIKGTDLSSQMIEEATQKPGSDKVSWSVLDMLDLDAKDEYDTILCYCDSMNYLASFEDVTTVAKKVYEALHAKGTFLFDIHSMDRLEEFAEDYIEEGDLDDVCYQWTIRSEDDLILHSFTFYDSHANMVQEQHIQHVFEPQKVKAMLETIGYQVEMYTDFDLKGEQEGEKIFFVARKDA